MSPRSYAVIILPSISLTALHMIESATTALPRSMWARRPPIAPFIERAGKLYLRTMDVLGIEECVHHDVISLSMSAAHPRIST
jgi:hypothetical protein